MYFLWQICPTYKKINWILVVFFCWSSSPFLYFFIIILDSPFHFTFANGLHFHHPLPTFSILLASYFPVATSSWFVTSTLTLFCVCACVCYFHENSWSLGLTFHLYKHTGKKLWKCSRMLLFCVIWKMKMKMMMIWWPEKHKWIMFFYMMKYCRAFK